MSDNPTLYRKRLIPMECICLENDKVLLRNEQMLLTRWTTLHPKKDLDHGMSCYLLNAGWKISRFLDKHGNMLCWYCDIMEYDYDSRTDTYVFTDLLADVIIYPDGRVRVVDLDEIADALEEGVFTVTQTKECLRKLDALLREVYAGRIPKSEEDFWNL